MLDDLLGVHRDWGKTLFEQSRDILLEPKLGSVHTEGRRDETDCVDIEVT